MFRTHRPLVPVVVCFGLGIILESFLHISFTCFWLAAFLCLGASVRWPQRRILSMVFLLASVLFSAGTEAQEHKTYNWDHLSFYSCYLRFEPLFLMGVIDSDVVVKGQSALKKATFVLRVEQIDTGKERHNASGRILVNLYQTPFLSYGDRIVLRGRWHEPFDFSASGRSSYRQYLARSGILLVLTAGKKEPLEILARGQGHPLWAYAYSCRQRLERLIAQYLRPEEAGILQAILLGDRSQIPTPVKDLFVATGTAHILAISGLNMTMIAWGIFIVLKIIPLPRRARFLLTIVGVGWYALLAGLGASVARASLMAAVYLWGMFLEREGDLLNSLSLAALILLVLNPMNIYDVGFQLSFVSVLGLIQITPLLEKMLPVGETPSSRIKEFFYRWVVQPLIVSTAVWLATAGLVAYYFEIVTPIALLANLVVVPLMFLLTLLGLGLLVCGFLLPVFAAAFAACVSVVLKMMIVSIELMNVVPGGSWRCPDVSLAAVAVYYLGICFFLIRDSDCEEK